MIRWLRSAVFRTDAPGTPWFSRARRAHLHLGRRGEQLATRLLRELGLDILCRNYRGPHGELDIVAREGGVLCFVEVKTRRVSSRPGRPGAAVGAAKRRNLVHTARRYLHRLGHPPIPHRYDIVEILFDRHRGGPLQATYQPHAFREDELRAGAATRFPTVLGETVP
jgi:putative endonuclease